MSSFSLTKKKTKETNSPEQGKKLKRHVENGIGQNPFEKFQRLAIEMCRNGERQLKMLSVFKKEKKSLRCYKC